MMAGPRIQGRALALAACCVLLVLAGGCTSAGDDATGDGPAVAEPTDSPDAPATDLHEEEPTAEGSAPDQLRPSGPFATDVLTLRAPDGQEVQVPVYVADEPQLRRRGLMHTDDLPADAGMVFRFSEDTDSAFHMQDTLVPLSIAFADADGEILMVLDMEPCGTQPCERYDPQVTYRTALEVNQGFFDTHGVEPGWAMEEPVPAAR